MPRDHNLTRITFPAPTQPPITPLEEGRNVICDMAVALRLALEFTYILEAREKAKHRDYHESVDAVIAGLSKIYDDATVIDNNGRHQIGAAEINVDGKGYGIRTTIERIDDSDKSLE